MHLFKVFLILFIFFDSGFCGIGPSTPEISTNGFQSCVRNCATSVKGAVTDVKDFVIDTFSKYHPTIISKFPIICKLRVFPYNIKFEFLLINVLNKKN